ncbi:MAG: hypothetical protein Q9225_004896 [Loekoesia sp. 1 TL-2023]
MGVWGHGIYQFDSDLDILDLIAKEATKMFPDPDCLRCPLMSDYLTLRFPIDKPTTVEQLNAGIFHRLLRRFKHSKNDMAVILLAAVGMELGVKLDEEDILMIKVTVMKADIGDEKRDQMIKALEEYKNDGTEWDFNSNGVIETANDTLKEAIDRKEEAANAESEIKTSAQEPAATVTHDKTGKQSQGENSTQKELKSALKKSKEENHVAFRLPKSKSQPSLRGQEGKESKNTSSKRTARESIFTLPVREKPEDLKEDSMDHAESIFRLPPPQPMTKGRGKGNRELG